MNRPTRLILLSALPMLALLSVSCSSTDSGGVAQITKVNPYHLKPGMWVQTEDPMIQFEQRHYLHGAVSTEDYASKFGHYFTIFWKTASKGSEVTVRLEYLQANTGPTVHTQEVAVANAKGRNTTQIAVTGEDYVTGGPVIAWKASLVSGGQTLGEYKSFQWK
ncbi:MAG: hypothetical protein KDL87_07365 [Verrucomicrobiae bacterium]|nr:hypothetical protein [Verrucomicrobiae bacterium]